jgi:hypothetical protein
MAQALMRMILKIALVKGSLGGGNFKPGFFLA